MGNERVFRMPFASIYPLYLKKAEKKGRTKQEVDILICWLTGYNNKALQQQIDRNVDLETFFGEAPQINRKATEITGLICGTQVEEIEDPLMQNIRRMDKLIDELAKGRKVEKILRGPAMPL